MYVVRRDGVQEKMQAYASIKQQIESAYLSLVVAG